MLFRDPGLAELGLRMQQRRTEAGLDRSALAERAGIAVGEIDAFETGRRGMGLPALIRIARALGVPPMSFIHVRAPVVAASVEPDIVLRATGAAWLQEQDRAVLGRALHRARMLAEAAEVLPGPHLAENFTATAAPASSPHVSGYEAAKVVRERLVRSGPLRNLARLLEDQFDILVLRHRFADTRLMGAACRLGNARLVAVNIANSMETTRRFALAHELGHQLLDLDESGASADEVPDSKNHWFDKKPHEKRADAFAAMLLAPATAVAECIGPPRNPVAAYDQGKAMVQQVRGYVGMGFAAAAWHLHNLGYLEKGLTETLLLAEPEADPVDGFEEETRFDGLERRVLEAYARELISRGRARELLGGLDPEAFEAAL